MTQELKDKWVAALKSGTYVQGRQMLKTPDGRFCCMGVLCDVAGLNYSPSNPSRFPLPAALGVPTGVQAQLSFMNDDTDNLNGFPEIADYIDQILATDAAPLP